MRKDTYVRWLAERIANCRTHLDQIKQSLAEEISKPILQRQQTTFLFLDRERSVYTFALKELEDALAMINDGKE